MKQQKTGFTLVEVLVAMTILAIGVIALMQMFPESLRMSRRAAERTQVSSFARTELGRVKAAGVGNLTGQDSWAVRNAFRQLSDAQKAYSLYDGWKSSVQRVGGDVELFRVTFSVDLSEGRAEKFVTYVTSQ